MAKVILICGKICSGKSTYAEKIRKKYDAAVLSVDEIMLALFGQHVGDKHDEYCEKLQNYLFDKSSELIRSGINVILDWGFWQKDERKYAKKFCKDRSIECELHYIDVPDRVWRQRVAKRNSAVSEGKADAYYVDKNLAVKFGALFEAPVSEEIDVYVPSYEIRMARGDEIDEALDLALDVFMKFEAPEYKPEGVETFKHFISESRKPDSSRRQGLSPIYAAFENEKIIGIMGMRETKTHINLVFVKEEYHRKGVATALFNFLLNDLIKENPELSEITLNSSPYGFPFYLRLGFVPQSEEKEKDGIRYTPMKYTVKGKDNVINIRRI